VVVVVVVVVAAVAVTTIEFQYTTRRYISKLF
jgi:hypothetical protein